MEPTSSWQISLFPRLSCSGSLWPPPPMAVLSWFLLLWVPLIFLKAGDNNMLNWPLRMPSIMLSNWSMLSLTWDCETVVRSHIPSQHWNLWLIASMTLATKRPSKEMWSWKVFLLRPIVMTSCLILIEQTLSSPKKISHAATKSWNWVPMLWKLVGVWTVCFNSLTHMDGRDPPLLNKLCGTVVSHQNFIRSQSLRAHWMHNDLSLTAVACNFYEACCINDVSRGSKMYLFCAS